MQETATGEASAKTNKANGKAQGNRRNRPDDAILADILRHIADLQDAKVLSLSSTVCLQTDGPGCSAHLNHGTTTSSSKRCMPILHPESATRAVINEVINCVGHL